MTEEKTHTLTDEGKAALRTSIEELKEATRRLEEAVSSGQLKDEPVLAQLIRNAANTVIVVLGE